ncbi:unnamed protein product [Mesocestoides corti]|uniref:Elongator complex protein 1 n=1 Tax=Mesocestoides corti TaxID=53468 RepID=A0A158QT46_MESCO|nr:unnamed protein product [Mesocestoides corti]
MRNVRPSACSSSKLENTFVTDIGVDSFSGDLWIGTSSGISHLRGKYCVETFYSDKPVSKIVFLNLPSICVLCNRELLILELPNQVRVIGDVISYVFKIIEHREFDDDLFDCVFCPDLSIGVALSGNFVSVGWGKEETQFKGKKRGPQDLVEPTEPLLSTSYLPGQITWREDGQFFAILWSDASEPTVQRRLHVFDVNAELKSVGMETKELETGLCWRPKVQLIAASKRRSGRCLQVAFFELNGLQHGEVDLLYAPDCSKFRVDKIAFHPLDHIMAVLFLPLSPNDGSATPFVKLFTVSNYHWNVEAVFSLVPYETLRELTPGPISLVFGNASETGTSTLHTAVSLGPEKGALIRSLSLVRSIDRSCSLTPDDPALVAVIDGCSVRLTGFAHCSVPPPMCATKLSFPASVAAVSLSGLWASSSKGAVSMFVQLSNSESAFWLTISPGWKSADKATKLCNDTLVVEREQVSKEVAPFVSDACIVGKDALVFVNKQADVILKGQILHCTWISPENLCFVSEDGRFLGMMSKHVVSDSIKFDVRCLASLSENSVATISGLVCGPNGDVAVQVGDGDIYIVNVKSLGDLVSPAILGVQDVAVRLPFACNQLYVVPFRCAGAVAKPTPLLVGLQSSTHRLCAAEWNSSVHQAAGECVMQLCSSIAVHPHFLLVTSLQSELFSVPLALEPEEFQSILKTIKQRLCASRTADQPPGLCLEHPSSAQSRALELGASLVTAVPGGTKVVLQMPRGNLEDVHPRALVFNYLTPLFDSLRHAEAVETMRRHRINFNLLYDYNPRKFLSNVHNFVHQLGSTEHITLLVSDLREEDITETEYNGFFGKKPVPARRLLDQAAAKVRGDVPRGASTEPCPPTAAKVNLVCDALLKAMLPEKSRFILPILTCYVKKCPSEVEKGLLLLKDFRGKGDASTWSRGLRHLQYYLSPVNLFHVALGTYDLELAEAMAERTQLDPKEYQPCLRELGSLVGDGVCSRDVEVAYQHARIDLLLQRYSKALKNLHLSGAAHWEELCGVIKKQKLFSEALELFTPRTLQFSEISRLWAEALTASQRLAAAGEVHLRAGHYASAASLFLSTNSCLLWRLTVDTARSTPAFGECEQLPEEEVRRQATRLALNLKSLRRFTEAIPIYTDYLQDYEGALRAATECGLWTEARRLALCVDGKDLVTSVIKHSAIQAYEHLCGRFADEEQEFHRVFERLLKVRADLRANATKDELGGEVFDDAESELFSETGSVTSGTSVSSRDSFFSKASGRSRKNRRKQDRKKWSVKEGSKFEEVALIQVIYNIIESFQRLAESIPPLVDELWRLGEAELARKIVRRSNSLLTDHRACINIVWCPEITGNQGSEQADDRGGEIQQRRYTFHESFLLFPPAITVKRINSEYVL